MAEQQNFDKALFERIRRDDRLALNTLFSQYYQKLCSFAFTYLKDEADSEECVADVFVTIWRTRKNLAIQKSLKAYLYISVRNAAWAQLKRRDSSLDNVDSALECADPDSPETLLEFVELQDQLQKAVDKLPPRCRQVFMMSRLELMSYKEISEVLGISENTVENHLVKAIAILRKFTKQYHDNPPRHPQLTEA